MTVLGWKWGRQGVEKGENGGRKSTYIISGSSWEKGKIIMRTVAKSE